MSKLNNLDVELELSTFKTELGANFGKIVADTKSVLGRLTDKAFTTSVGKWKAASGGKLKSADGNTVQLDLNNPSTSLLLFGMKIRAIAEAGEMEIQSEIPAVCRAWIDKLSKTPAAVAA